MPRIDVFPVTYLVLVSLVLHHNDAEGSDLVGYWPLNGSGDDESSFANDATLSTAISFEDDIANNSFAAASFQGDTDSCIEIAADSSTALSAFPSGFTVSLFVKLHAIDGDEVLLNKEDAMTVWVDTLRRLSVSGSDAQFAMVLKVEQWYHVAFSMSSSDIVVYVDGLPVSRNTLIDPIHDNDNVLHLGCYGSDRLDGTLNGALDEVRIYSSALSPSEVRTIYTDYWPDGANALSPVDSPVSQPGLVGYWPFDGDAKDHTENANHAYIFDQEDTVLTEDMHGNKNGAYLFDGPSSGMVVNAMAGSGLSNFSSGITISFFVKFEAIDADAVILNKWNSSAAWVDSVGRLRISASHWYETGAILEIGEWYNVAFSFSTSESVVYLNAFPIRVVHGVASIDSDNLLYVGQGAGSGDFDFEFPSKLHGALDELRLYSRVLSPSEVRTIYTDYWPDGANALSPVDSPVSQPGLIGYWPFDGDAKDHTENANHAYIFDQEDTVLTEDMHGNKNGAYLFDGPSSGMVVNAMAGSGLSNFSSGVTLSMFVKYVSLDFEDLETEWEDGGSIIFKGNSKADDGFAFWVDQRGYLKGWGSSDVEAPVLNVGQWYHFAVSRYPSERPHYWLEDIQFDMVIYLNGYPLFESSPYRDPDVSTNDVLFFGRNGSGERAIAAIDEVRIYSSALSSSEVRTIYTDYWPDGARSPVDSPVSQAGLVGYWPFDGDAKDHTENANHGFILDGVKPTFAEDMHGNKNGALALEGAVPRIAVEMQSTRDITLSLFFKIDQFEQGYGSGFLVTGPGFGLWVDEYGELNGAGDYTSNPILKLGQWYHFAVSTDLTRPYVLPDDRVYYLNGAPFDYEDKIFAQWEIDQWLIRFGTRLDGRSSGALDEVRLYSSALSPSEVRTIYTDYWPDGANALSPVDSPVSQPGLVGYWPFDGDAKDHTENANHAFIFDQEDTVLTEDMHGNKNGAYLFDGPSSGMVVNAMAGSGLSSFSSGFTISFFVKFKAIDGDEHLFRIGSDLCFVLGVENLWELKLSVGGEYVSVSSDFEAGQWNHMAVTLSPDTLVVYRDGEPIAYGAEEEYNFCVKSHMLLFFGRWPNGFDQSHKLNGALDEIRIYSYPLQEEEVLGLYQSYTSDRLVEQVFAEFEAVVGQKLEETVTVTSRGDGSIHMLSGSLEIDSDSHSWLNVTVSHTTWSQMVELVGLPLLSEGHTSSATVTATFQEDGTQSGEVVWTYHVHIVVHVRYFNLTGWTQSLNYTEDTVTNLPSLSLLTSDAIATVHFRVDGLGSILDHLGSNISSLTLSSAQEFRAIQVQYQPFPDSFEDVEVVAWMLLDDSPENVVAMERMKLVGVSVNDAPELFHHNGPFEILGGSFLRDTLRLHPNTFVDRDGDDIVIRAYQAETAALPAWLSFDEDAYTFSGFVPAELVGSTLSIAVIATDGKLNATDVFELQIVAIAVEGFRQVRQVTEDDGIITFESMWIASSTGFATLVITPSDLAAGTLILPSYASVDSVSGAVTIEGTDAEINEALALLSFQPEENFSGDVNFSLVVEDGIGNVSSGELQVFVDARNDPPTVEGKVHDQSFKSGTRISLVIDPADYFSDPDVGDTLSYTSRLLGGNPLPAFLEFSPPSEETSMMLLYVGTPDSDDAGLYDIEILATDSAGEQVSTTFKIAIEATSGDFNVAIEDESQGVITSQTTLHTILYIASASAIVFAALSFYASSRSQHLDNVPRNTSRIKMIFFLWEFVGLNITEPLDLFSDLLFFADLSSCVLEVDNVSLDSCPKNVWVYWGVSYVSLCVSTPLLLLSVDFWSTFSHSDREVRGCSRWINVTLCALFCPLSMLIFMGTAIVRATAFLVWFLKERGRIFSQDEVPIPLHLGYDPKKRSDAMYVGKLIAEDIVQIFLSILWIAAVDFTVGSVMNLAVSVFFCIYGVGEKLLAIRRKELEYAKSHHDTSSGADSEVSVDLSSS